jgi:hypothetical protein
MRKSFCVFNFEQMEGVLELQIEKGDFDPIPKCEEVLKKGSRPASFFLLPEEGSYKSPKNFLSMVKSTLSFL